MTGIAGLTDFSDECTLLDPDPFVDVAGDGVVPEVCEPEVVVIFTVGSDDDGVAPAVVIGRGCLGVEREVLDAVTDLHDTTAEGSVDRDSEDGIARTVARVPHVEVVGVLLTTEVRVVTVVALHAVDRLAPFEGQEDQRSGVGCSTVRVGVRREENPREEEEKLQSLRVHLSTLACVC